MNFQTTQTGRFKSGRLGQGLPTGKTIAVQKGCNLACFFKAPLAKQHQARADQSLPGCVGIKAELMPKILQQDLQFGDGNRDLANDQLVAFGFF